MGSEMCIRDSPSARKTPGLPVTPVILNYLLVLPGLSGLTVLPGLSGLTVLPGLSGLTVPPGSSGLTGSPGLSGDPMFPPR